jgi:hypothetical protein
LQREAQPWNLLAHCKHFATHASQSTLLLWRERLVAQFEAEGRGATWVLNGKLQQRQSSQLYSPHYPVAPVYIGAPVNFQAFQACTLFFSLLRLMILESRAILPNLEPKRYEPSIDAVQ